MDRFVKGGKLTWCVGDCGPVNNVVRDRASR